MTHVATLRVLVIDDDPLQQQFAQAALATLGVDTISFANDGQEALDKVGLELDVIVCDLRMPGMDGMTFMGELSRRPFAGALILTSGESDQVLRSAGELANAHNLVLLGVAPKPFTADSLGALLTQYSPTPAARTTAPSGPQVDARTLDDAMAAGRLKVHYQPQVRLDTGRIAGWEALSRWIDPIHGVIGPDAYIPLAESTGQIHQLTHQTLDQVLEETSRLATAGEWTVSINLSAACLVNPTLPDRIAKTAHAGGVPTGRLQFEITESQVLDNLAEALEVLTRLRLKGFGLSIDDFGTGYSSMKQLSMLPVTEIKIDKSFVLAAPTDPAARAIVEAAVDLAAKLDLVTVAEGVEERVHWDLMVELGVEVAQGYFIAHPMPAPAAAEWKAQWTQDHPPPASGARTGHPARDGSDASRPAYDPDTLRALIGDDASRHADFLTAFLEQARSKRPDLASALARGDATAIDDLGHQLKSSARGVGAPAFGEVCEQLEDAGKSGRLEAVADLLIRFDAEVERFVRHAELE